MTDLMKEETSELSFEEIECSFPEKGFHSCDCGWNKVSAQFLHDFAKTIYAKGIAEGRRQYQEELAKMEPVGEIFYMLERNDTTPALWFTFEDLSAGWYWTDNADKALKFQDRMDAWWLRKILLLSEWDTFSVFGIDINITEHVFYTNQPPMPKE